MTEEIN